MIDGMEAYDEKTRWINYTLTELTSYGGGTS